MSKLTFSNGDFNDGVSNIEQARVYLFEKILSLSGCESSSYIQVIGESGVSNAYLIKHNNGLHSPIAVTERAIKSGMFHFDDTNIRAPYDITATLRTNRPMLEYSAALRESSSNPRSDYIRSLDAICFYSSAAACDSGLFDSIMYFDVDKFLQINTEREDGGINQLDRDNKIYSSEAYKELVEVLQQDESDNGRGYKTSFEIFSEDQLNTTIKLATHLLVDNDMPFRFVQEKKISLK